jgi:hypothetical protein
MAAASTVKNSATLKEIKKKQKQTTGNKQQGEPVKKTQD